MPLSFESAIISLAAHTYRTAKQMSPDKVMRILVAFEQQQQKCESPASWQSREMREEVIKVRDYFANQTNSSLSDDASDLLQQYPEKTE